jgi:hypothetical protein
VVKNEETGNFFRAFRKTVGRPQAFGEKSRIVMRLWFSSATKKVIDEVHSLRLRDGNESAKPLDRPLYTKGMKYYEFVPPKQTLSLASYFQVS